MELIRRFAAAGAGGRGARALALGTLVLGLSACTLDRTPEIGADRARYRDVLLPDRTDPAAQGFMFEDSANAQAATATTGGLRCADVFCPFTQPPLEPCCTDSSDVERGSAMSVGACGVDFSATGSELAGSCWQRDQLGVLDPECADYTPAGGVGEAGCCTSEGKCGTFNTAQGLGCHYAPGGGEPESCGMDEIDRSVECTPTGIFGIKNEVDVTWGGRSGGLVELTDDGRDKIVIHLKVFIDRVSEDNNIVARAQPCGVDLPQFYSSTLCESYKPIFPVEMWESANMPQFPLTGSYQCLNPGCILSINALTTLLGIELANPEAPWPTSAQTGSLDCTSGQGAQCFPDHDGDGAAGLTIELLTQGMAPMGVACDGVGYTYEGAPLSASPAAVVDGVRRASAVLLGTRVKLGGSGRISDDCNSGLGAGIAEFVQSRAWGCIVQEGTVDAPFGLPAGPNEPCTAAQAAFMDENLPIYRVLNLDEEPDPILNVTNAEPSDGPITRVVRLGDLGSDVSCAQVREAAYPE